VAYNFLTADILVQPASELKVLKEWQLAVGYITTCIGYDLRLRQELILLCFKASCCTSRAWLSLPSYPHSKKKSTILQPPLRKRCLCGSSAELLLVYISDTSFRFETRATQRQLSGLKKFRPNFALSPVKLGEGQAKCLSHNK